MINSPRLRDYFALTSQQESLSQETHTISEASPYFADLDQIPKIASAATNVNDNEWVNTTQANALMTIEIETSPATWQAATIVASSSPGALEVYLQIKETATFPYSPRMIFNSAYAGDQVRVTYTGFGSAPLAKYFEVLFQTVEALSASGTVTLIESSLYNNGNFDGFGDASTSCYATPSQLMYAGHENLPASFPGLTLAFGSAGNAEVAAFTNADYWKRILLRLSYNGTVWSLITQESAESVSQAGLTTPTPAGSGVIGYVDVQNDGTPAVAGSILDLDTDNLIPITHLQAKPTVSHQLQKDGTITVSQYVGYWFPGKNGNLTGMTLFSPDSGTAGTTRVNIFLCSIADQTGATIFTSTAEQPQFAAGGAGVAALDSTPAADILTPAFTTTGYYRCIVEVAPTAGTDLFLVLHAELNE